MTADNNSAEEGLSSIRCGDVQPDELFAGLRTQMQSIAGGIHEILHSPAQTESADLDKIRELAEIMRDLTYDEYLTIDAYLRTMDAQAHTARRTMIEDGTAEPVKLQAVKHILADLPKFTGGRPAIVLLRMACPYGKNIANPTFDPQKGPVTFQADRPIEMYSQNKYGRYNTISIAPDIDGSGGVTVTAENKQYHLKDEESVIVGRRLLQDELFGVELPHEKDRRAIDIHPGLETNDKSSFSRIGILIFVRSGKLYIFDRSVKNPIFIEQGAQSVKYDPEMRTESGSFGASQWSNANE